MKGKLIVIDGSDSSGKKTQTELLMKRLQEDGHCVKTLDFPQYGSFFGSLVAKYLKGDYGSLTLVDPKIASLLYALDRFDQREKLRGWLSQGCVVVLDRYVESNMGYQVAREKKAKEKLISWLQKLEYDKFDLPKADLVIYLHVPVVVSQELIKSRPLKGYLNGAKKDMHEEDLDFQQNVVENYLALSTRFGWHVIECTKENSLRSKEDIAGSVYALVSSLLSA